MSPDVVNGVFELVGAFFVWANVRRLWRDKTIAGVYWPTTAFFAIWGLWNLYYYPAIEQWYSFVGGIVLVSGNAVWVAMAVRIKLKEKDDELDSDV